MSRQLNYRQQVIAAKKMLLGGITRNEDKRDVRAAIRLAREEEEKTERERAGRLKARLAGVE